jgi:hypothetical protein
MAYKHHDAIARLYKPKRLLGYGMPCPLLQHCLPDTRREGGCFERPHLGDRNDFHRSTVLSSLRGRWRGNRDFRGLWLGWRRAHRRPRSRTTIVGSHSIANLARICGLRLFDRVDHDPRRWQGTRLFSQRAAKGLHGLVVHTLDAAVLSQQSPHLGDVVIVTATLLGPLLEHIGAAGKPAGDRRPAKPRCSHARSEWRPRTPHRGPRRTGSAWTSRPVAWWSTSRWWCELGLELARSRTTTPARTARSSAAWTSTAWSATPVAPKLFAAVFSSRRTLAAIAIELTVRVQIISFEIAIYTLATRACGPATRRGFDDHQRGLILLWNLCRRKPGLLQRGVLAEQRFLQRPSHTFSLISVKFLAPSAQHSHQQYRDRHSPPLSDTFIAASWQSSNVTRSPEPKATRTIFGEASA